MASMKVAPLKALIRELIKKRRLDPKRADKVAREYVAECGCKIIPVTKEGLVVEMIVTADDFVYEPPRIRKAK